MTMSKLTLLHIIIVCNRSLQFYHFAFYEQVKIYYNIVRLTCPIGANLNFLGLVGSVLYFDLFISRFKSWEPTKVSSIMGLALTWTELNLYRLNILGPQLITSLMQRIWLGNMENITKVRGSQSQKLTLFFGRILI